jgi:uncharacterized membrane protein YhaH (DUF805 family)
MGFGESIKHVFSNLTNFSGRASRSEFWWFYLFLVIVEIIFAVILNVVVGNSSSGSLSTFLFYVIYVVLFLASLSVSVRRLHDSNKSGWLVLLGLLCCVGQIILIVFFVQPSTEGDNSYGPRPAA